MEHPLPHKVMAYVGSFMLPSDIDLRTPAVITNNTTQPSESFVEALKINCKDMMETNLRS